MVWGGIQKSSIKFTAGLIKIAGVFNHSLLELCVFKREEALISAGINFRGYNSYAISIQLCLRLYWSVEGS